MKSISYTLAITAVILQVSLVRGWKSTGTGTTSPAPPTECSKFHPLISPACVTITTQGLDCPALDCVLAQCIELHPVSVFCGCSTIYTATTCATICRSGCGTTYSPVNLPCPTTPSCGQGGTSSPSTTTLPTIISTITLPTSSPFGPSIISTPPSWPTTSNISGPTTVGYSNFTVTQTTIGSGVTVSGGASLTSTAPTVTSQNTGASASSSGAVATVSKSSGSTHLSADAILAGLIFVLLAIL